MPQTDDPVAFHVPADIDDDRLIGALGRVASVETERRRSVDRVFLDTFDGRLQHHGLTVWRGPSTRGASVTLTLQDADGSTRPATAAPARADRIFASDVATGDVHDVIAAAIEQRALLTQVRVRSSVRRVAVCNADAKTVARVAIEAPTVVLSKGAGEALARRVHVAPVRGYRRALRRVTDTFESGLDLAPVAEPLMAEAQRIAGVAVGGVSSKVTVDLEPTMRADHASILICRRLADIVDANLPGTLGDIDTEFLHDLRVAVRRTRSVVKEMKCILPSGETEQARSDLRWIQEITGPTRDLDVQLEAWPSLVGAVRSPRTDDLAVLHTLLTRQRASAFARMRRQMTGPRFAAAWSAWRDLLERPLPVDDDGINAPVAEVAGRRVVTVYSSMVERGSVIDDDSAPEALHDLRKRGKELRYLLELFGDLWPPDAVAPLVATLKDLQDVLGRFQDDEIQHQRLRSLAPELHALPGGTDALIALGVVIDELTTDQRRARRSLAERFAPFAAAPTRHLVRDTFGRHAKRRTRA